jgi:hypothetical protein
MISFQTLDGKDFDLDYIKDIYAIHDGVKIAICRKNEPPELFDNWEILLPELNEARENYLRYAIATAWSAIRTATRMLPKMVR